ncbi:unnamed protein product [Mytilus coruscus]|uniref:Reverse transcriptase domain-containing protein n=1 Tax=Mytilus coruscus TaxID=42192 RepID=A0A6J8BG34_MYTCO|nr:unnamed protein product [Mytilus coruscus]
MTVKVKWNNNLSDEFVQELGVRQGTKLSTVLYKGYNITILIDLERSKLGASIGNINVAAPTCANDIAILAGTEHEAQALLNIVHSISAQDLTYALARSLIGIEVTNYTPADILKLDRLQLQICRQIQGLPARTANAATVYVMRGIEPIQAVVDRIVLTFFGGHKESDLCTLCDLCKEDSKHFLLECTALKDITEKHLLKIEQHIRNTYSETDKTVPKCGFNPFTKPYWTFGVKIAHEKERSLRKAWVIDGRPRGMHHDSYRLYKRAKHEFRNIQQAAYEQYIQQTNDDINKAAESDIRLFWKLIKRNKTVSSKIYPEIIQDDTPESIANAFMDYFSKLYQPDSDEVYDNDTKQQIELDYNKILKSCYEQKVYLPGGIIQESEVDGIIKLLKRRKASVSCV